MRWELSWAETPAGLGKNDKEVGQAVVRRDATKHAKNPGLGQGRERRPRERNEEEVEGKDGKERARRDAGGGYKKRH